MANNAGRSGRRWRRLVAEVYERRSLCCRCGQTIDYDLDYLDPITGRPNPDAKSVDHYPFPLSTHPHLAEDPSNLAPAHRRCNLAAGNRVDATRELGSPSEDW